MLALHSAEAVFWLSAVSANATKALLTIFLVSFNLDVSGRKRLPDPSGQSGKTKQRLEHSK